MDGRLRFLNRAAEALLKVSAADVVGELCCSLVRGRDECGAPFCEPYCELRASAEAGLRVRPISLHVLGKRAVHRAVRIIALPVRSENGERKCLVECALDHEPANRLQRYFKRILSRHRTGGTAASEPISQVLSPREQEILQRLAEAQELRTIARQLHISYPTVRNHVQHILSKLGTHSIEESVARYLLRSDD